MRKKGDERQRGVQPSSPTVLHAVAFSLLSTFLRLSFRVPANKSPDERNKKKHTHTPISLSVTHRDRCTNIRWNHDSGTPTSLSFCSTRAYLRSVREPPFNMIIIAGDQFRTDSQPVGCSFHFFFKLHERRSDSTMQGSKRWHESSWEATSRNVEQQGRRESIRISPSSLLSVIERTRIQRGGGGSSDSIIHRTRGLLRTRICTRALSNSPNLFATFRPCDSLSLGVLISWNLDRRSSYPSSRVPPGIRFVHNSRHSCVSSKRETELAAFCQMFRRETRREKSIVPRERFWANAAKNGCKANKRTTRHPVVSFDIFSTSSRVLGACTLSRTIGTNGGANGFFLPVHSIQPLRGHGTLVRVHHTVRARAIKRAS